MSFDSILNKFEGLRALVIGDLMLDEYIFGSAARISPEAPVMVVKHKNTSQLPGGAANVGLNLQALGAEVAMIGVVGCDEGGELLLNALNQRSLEEVHLISDPNRPTTRKTRVLADHAHQVLRIDSEDDSPINDTVETEMESLFQKLIPQSDVLVLSDYLKGTLTPGVCSKAIEQAKQAGVPVVVNPKPRSLANYAGASLISLNRAEATQALDRWKPISTDEAVQAAQELRKKHQLESVLITLGEDGMVASGSSEEHIDAPRVEVYDTAGAGDTVVATVALGLAACGFERNVFALAAQTAASVVKRVGVATPSPEDLKAIRKLS